MKIIGKTRQLVEFLKSKKGIPARHFLFRALVFFILFALGPFALRYYIEHRLEYLVRINDGFAQYLIFVIFIVFIFICWKKICQLPKYKQNYSESGFFLLAALPLYLLPVGIFGNDGGLNGVIGYLTGSLLGNICLFLAVFNRVFVRYFYQEISLILLVVILFRLAPVVIDFYWQYSSKVTLFGLQIIFPLVPLPSSVEMANYTASLGEFTVSIGPSCAGIHSLTAFAVLFLVWTILVRQYKQIYIGKALVAFCCGLVAVFLLNTIRVMSILLLGAYYSQEFAIEIFHEQIGAWLLLGLFVLYLYLVFPKLIKK